jgi:hypothetical protein
MEIGIRMGLSNLGSLVIMLDLFTLLIVATGSHLSNGLQYLWYRTNKILLELLDQEILWYRTHREAKQKSLQMQLKTSSTISFGLSIQNLVSSKSLDMAKCRQDFRGISTTLVKRRRRYWATRIRWRLFQTRGVLLMTWRWCLVFKALIILCSLIRFHLNSLGPLPQDLKWTLS